MPRSGWPDGPVPTLGCAEVKLKLESRCEWRFLSSMSTVQEIESAITQLSIEEMAAIRDWLDETMEEQLAVSDEFKAKIARARQEIAQGEFARVRSPDSIR